jgi:hypothetical protein
MSFHLATFPFHLADMDIDLRAIHEEEVSSSVGQGSPLDQKSLPHQEWQQD